MAQGLHGARLQDPALFLADEPTGELDSRSTADVLALFAELHESGPHHRPDHPRAGPGRGAGRVVRIRDGLVEGAPLAAGSA